MSQFERDTDPLFIIPLPNKDFEMAINDMVRVITVIVVTGLLDAANSSDYSRFGSEFFWTSILGGLLGVFAYHTFTVHVVRSRILL